LQTMLQGIDSMLLGLDLGTTNIKALCVNEDGTVVSQGSSPVDIQHLPDGAVEQDIEQIWQSTLDAIRQAGQNADLSSVRAIGISSQGGAIQIRSEDGQCVGKVISWLDFRGAPYDEQLTKDMGEEWFTPRVGHSGSAVAIGQVLRLRKTNPNVLTWPNRLGFVGDTIVQRLCGRAAHDYSSLSICNLYNPSLKACDPDLLNMLGLREAQLPDLIPATQSAGPLTALVANTTNLPEGIPVSAAIHDQYAAALGCGATEPGDVMFGAGTAWILLAVADHLIPPISPLSWVCDHLMPGRWGQIVSLVIGGSVFKWALDLANLTDASSKQIDDLLDSAGSGSDGLLLLPFLDGTGGQNRLPGGVLRNMKLSHNRGHLLRATLEGLCYELSRQLGWLVGTGCPVNRLIMCGNATQSRCTPQIVADITGREVICPSQPEISAFGAAILAKGLTEPGKSLADLYRSMVSQARDIKPGPTLKYYAQQFDQYIKSVNQESLNDV